MSEPLAVPVEPRTKAGKALADWLRFAQARMDGIPTPSEVRLIEDQAATEADLRLLTMTTARDAAVVEADLLREARRELDVDVLARALAACAWDDDWDSDEIAVAVAAEYRRLIEESHDQPKPPARPGTDPLTGKAHGKQRQDPLTGTWHDV